MAEVGELTWIAEIKEIAKSKKSAEEMSDGLEGLADQARETDAAVEQVGDSSGGLSDSFAGTGRSAGFLSGALGLLGSGLMLLVGQFTAASTASGALVSGLKAAYGWIVGGGLTGAISTLLGYGSSFIGWLAAGSAGALAFAAAIGAVIGLIGVWILKVTGILDWIGQLGTMLADSLPGWARDAILAVISIFAGGLALLGALIVGFMEGGLQGAIERGEEVIQIFGGAWERLFSGVMDAAGDFKDDIIAWGEGVAGDLSDTITGTVEGAWNAAVPDRIEIPEMSVGGQSISTTIAGQEIGGSLPEVSIGGQGLDLPQLATGGMIEEEGAFVGHEGEMVLPADVSREVIAALRSSGGGGGGGGSGITIEEQVIEIGDQSIDLSDLTRTQMETLADLIAEKQGDELTTLIG